MKKAGGKRKATLRTRAEDRLAKRKSGPTPPDDDEIRRLLHELEIHQVELQIQNEELFRARVEVESALERYTELFEFAPVGYALLDATGMIREVNLAAASIFGRDRVAFARIAFEALISPRDRVAFKATLVEALESDHPVSCELSSVTGAVLAMRAFALRRGQPRILLSIDDVSQERSRAVRLEESEHALREADHRKDEFLAMLSHELRNPLTPLRNGLFILSNGPNPDQAGRALAIMDRQLDHLTHLIDDLLDVTRISRGKVQLRRTPVDLGELVKRAVDDHRASFDAVGIALESAIQAGELIVDGDEVRLVQIVTNLLHNALKFTDPGGRLSVTLRARPPGVELILRDTGVGIAPALIDRVFDAFMQAPQASARSRGGLGLGLAMVKGLVELHGGTVRIESAGLGKGTQVTLWFPLAKPAAPRVPARAPEPRRSRRVLVIEDNLDAADSLRLALALAGHEVRVAYDGPAGLALAKAFHPNIVLCDIGLPGMDGYEVARALRADAELRGTYIAALTGYAQPEDIAHAEEAGFDRHVAKPVSSDKLEQILGEAGSGA